MILTIPDNTNQYSIHAPPTPLPNQLFQGTGGLVIWLLGCVRKKNVPQLQITSWHLKKIVENVVYVLNFLHILIPYINNFSCTLLLYSKKEFLVGNFCMKFSTSLQRRAGSRPGEL